MLLPLHLGVILKFCIELRFRLKLGVVLRFQLLLRLLFRLFWDCNIGVQLGLEGGLMHMPTTSAGG